MKQFFLKWLLEVIQNEQKFYAVYELKSEGFKLPLIDLEFIRTPHVPRVDEVLTLIRGNKIYFYRVIEVSHIYHYSSFELQEGNIVVKYEGEKNV